ncbi:MAG TPA: ABC transporter permease [Candidatus Binatia bacterium]|nr:ABC transporter permease [Candidatus Binatia bacterium]
MILLVRFLVRWYRTRHPAASRSADASSARPGSRGSARPARQRGATGPLGMVMHQAGYDLLSFARNRQAQFFTLLLPLLFLVIFVSIFGNSPVGPEQVRSATFFVPGIAAMGVMAPSFVNLVMSITNERESGVLKRRRATPVAAWTLIASRTLTVITVSLTVMTVLLLVGWLAYGVQVPASTIPGIFLTGLVGSACFCILGYALASVIRSAEAAQPMVQAITLPLYFISGVFVPNINLPSWLQSVASLFPVQHLADALHSAFVPGVQGTGIVWADLGVLALWALGGLVVALRRFSWVPAVVPA